MKKIKRVTNILRVTLLWLLVVVSFSSCNLLGCLRKKAKFTHGDETYSNFSGRLRVCAMSNTDTFPIDKVEFELGYGTFDIDDCKGYEAKGYYTKPAATVIFGLYILDGDWEKQTLRPTAEVEDYKNVENYYFVREILEEQAFSEDYGYTISYWRDVTYRHKEIIHIPKEIFKKEKGQFYVTLGAYRIEQNYYYCLKARNIGFSYVLTGNSVQLNFGGSTL